MHNNLEKFLFIGLLIFVCFGSISLIILLYHCVYHFCIKSNTTKINIDHSIMSPLSLSKVTEATLSNMEEGIPISGS